MISNVFVADSLCHYPVSPTTHLTQRCLAFLQAHLISTSRLPLYTSSLLRCPVVPFSLCFSPLSSPLACIFVQILGVMPSDNVPGYGTTSSQSEASSSSSPLVASSKSSLYDDEAQIPPPDRGRAAWLFLFGCFWLEGLVWGKSYPSRKYILHFLSLY